MRAKYKLITCDLDETLLNHEHELSDENLQAIRRAQAEGVIFVPATGRDHRSVQDLLKKLGVHDRENEYVISYNGGVMTENKANRLIHMEGLDFGLAEALYQAGLQYDVAIHIYTLDMTYIYRLKEEERGYLAGRMEITEISEPNLDFLKGQQIIKMLYANPDCDYLRRIEKDIRPLTEGAVSVSYSSNRFIELNRLGVSKGMGLRKLAGRLGIRPEETLAIGDNLNDLSMILEAGWGVGVANCVDELRPDCDYICSKSNDEHAVAEVIHTFVLPA